MQHEPLVSIILCTFNRKHLVESAIQSVFKQIHKNWELIIVDDGSSDGSEKILLPISKKDKRIIYTRHKNKGLALSRNVGLNLSSGEYVCFLDSDDEYLSNHISRRVTYVEKNSLFFNSFDCRNSCRCCDWISTEGRSMISCLKEVRCLTECNHGAKR